MDQGYLHQLHRSIVTTSLSLLPFVPPSLSLTLSLYPQVALDTFSFQEEVATAVSKPRLHHQLLPNILELEQGFSTKYRQILESKGHDIEIVMGGAVVQAIHVTGDRIYAASDPRKGGQPDHIWCAIPLYT